MSLYLDRSEWDPVKFDEIALSITDRIDDPSAAGVDRYVGLEHLDPGTMTVERWGSPDQVSAQKLRFQPGDVIFGRRRAYQKKVARADFEGICSAHALVLRAKPKRVLPDFLPVFLSSSYFLDRAISISVGSLSPTINWRDLRGEEFRLPPLDQQQRIADLLWAVESHVNMQQSLSATLDSAREALFDAELERGQTKAGWASKTVSDVVISGPSNGKSAPANDEQRGIPTLSISAVRQGRIEAGKAVKFVDISRSEVSAFVLQDDDFLVVRGNGNKQLMGRGGLVTGGLPEGCIFPDLLIRLRFDPEQILPEFAAEQWNSASRHQALLRHAKSTNGIWKINGKDIKQHQLVVPPIEEQLRILADIGDLKKAQAKVDAETSAVRSLRQLVLTEVFDR